MQKFNFRKLKGFIFRHRISAIVIVVALVGSLGYIAWYFSQGSSYKAPKLNLKAKTTIDNRVEAPLTGEKVDPSVLNKRALAVVVENFTEARPQSGYTDADIVYETLAEGGITRTLAIFQSKASKEIGPVRSARAYFVDWALEMNAVFAHVGGNADAIDLIKTVSLADLNQFYNGSYFWRSADRYAPHNVYTTTDKLYAAAKANGYDITKPPAKFASFKDDAVVSDRPTSQKVDIDFSYGDFHVTYNYDPKTNTYLRVNGGSKFVDKNSGIQIAPKNVVVLSTDITPFVNYVGEDGVHVAEVGSGKGYLFQDGKAITISWSKASRTAQTKYVDENGAEIKLNRGQTWIEVVPTGKSVTF